jgi:hypothetical protein
MILGGRFWAYPRTAPPSAARPYTRLRARRFAARRGGYWAVIGAKVAAKNFAIRYAHYWARK